MDADPGRTIRDFIAARGQTPEALEQAAALAMARCWPEGVPFADLERWQRIGPEIIAGLMGLSYDKLGIAREIKAHLEAIHGPSETHMWCARYAVERLLERRAPDDAADCVDAYTFLVFCAGAAWRAFTSAYR
jgi:hypothetical protein